MIVPLKDGQGLILTEMQPLHAAIFTLGTMTFPEEDQDPVLRDRGQTDPAHGAHGGAGPA